MPRRTVPQDFLEKCEYIAPGKMGNIRDPMFKRETLQRPKLGEGFTRGRPKQPDGFTYGHRTKWDPNGLAECLNWPIKPQTVNKIIPRDYNKTNIESSRANIHPVPAWEKFADKKNYERDVTALALARNRKPIFPKDMVFGHPPMPQTPINCVIAHRYKTEFDEKAIRRNEKLLMKLIVSHNKTPQPYDTMKSVVNMAPMLMENQDSGRALWKMKKFRSQGPRISSRWTREQEKTLMGKMYATPACDLEIHRY